MVCREELNGNVPIDPSETSSSIVSSVHNGIDLSPGQGSDIQETCLKLCLLWVHRRHILASPTVAVGLTPRGIARAASAEPLAHLCSGTVIERAPLAAVGIVI
uniref:Uncharacterized protein n=1 Tax=Odontella aurita TaxID=265563 RepID=A0A7S4MU26_9STRA